MLKWMLSLAAVAALTLSCSKSEPKILVLYYSQSSNTRTLAKEFQKQLGADIEEIVAVEPYTGSMQDIGQRRNADQSRGVLPEIEPLKSDISKYDIIFLGYPIWGGTFADPVKTLISQIDFTGKKVVPFCSFGSGGIDTSSRDLAAALKGATVLPGYGVRAARISAAPGEVAQFLRENGFVEGDFVKLDEFPAAHAVNDAESAIFDAAVGDYPMINAKATEVAMRDIPGGVEYLFSADSQGANPIKVYVTVEDGKAPEFTQVLR